MAKVLIVEDDVILAEMVSDALSAAFHQVEVINNGEEASSLLSHYDFDIIILDWELHGITGVEICQRYRDRGGKSPVIFLTGKAKLEHKAMGFDAGADDYLTKPFLIAELVMRVNALLRRPQDIVVKERTVGPVTINLGTREVRCNGLPVMLTPREFSLLEFLMKHPGHVFNTEDILNSVWQSTSEATNVAVRTTILRLRSKLAVGDASIIKTVHGVGYKVEE